MIRAVSATVIWSSLFVSRMNSADPESSLPLSMAARRGNCATRAVLIERSFDLFYFVFLDPTGDTSVWAATGGHG